MVKIKKLHLINYCGYRDLEFDFQEQNGDIKRLSMFVGPNGSGKSSMLEAIEILSSASRYHGRDMTLNFRKYTYDPDYDPAKQEYLIQLSMNKQYKRDNKGRIIIDENAPVEKMEGLETKDPDYLENQIRGMHNMQMIGVFATDSGDKEVVIETDGVKKNDLSADSGATSFHYYIDADDANNMAKFQLPAEQEEQFIDLAEAIYGYKCSLCKKVENLDKKKEKKLVFYTDFILTKPWGDKVHFKRMSDGEKKIATVVRYLCDPTYMNEYDIILLDNATMHVYAKRHARMIEKILNTFPDKQFIMTTHSSVLMSGLLPKYIYDLEEYKIEEARRLGIKLIYPDSQARTFEPKFVVR